MQFTQRSIDPRQESRQRSSRRPRPDDHARQIDWRGRSSRRGQAAGSVRGTIEESDRRRWFSRAVKDASVSDILDMAVAVDLGDGERIPVAPSVAVQVKTSPFCWRTPEGQATLACTSLGVNGILIALTTRVMSSTLEGGLPSEHGLCHRPRSPKPGRRQRWPRHTGEYMPLLARDVRRQLTVYRCGLGEDRARDGMLDDDRIELGSAAPHPVSTRSSSRPPCASALPTLVYTSLLCVQRWARAGKPALNSGCRLGRRLKSVAAQSAAEKRSSYRWRAAAESKDGTKPLNGGLLGLLALGRPPLRPTPQSSIRGQVERQAEEPPESHHPRSHRPRRSCWSRWPCWSSGCGWPTGRPGLRRSPGSQGCDRCGWSTGAGGLNGATVPQGRLAHPARQGQRDQPARSVPVPARPSDRPHRPNRSPRPGRARGEMRNEALPVRLAPQRNRRNRSCWSTGGPARPAQRTKSYAEPIRRA